MPVAHSHAKREVKVEAAPEKAASGRRDRTAAPANPLWSVLATHVPPVVQAKLEVGAPDDEYEREADRVADQVMRMPAGGPPGPPPEDEEDLIQKQATPSIGLLQRQPAALEEEQVLPGSGGVRRQADGPSAGSGAASSVGPSTGSRIESLRGQGELLDAKTRADFETRFGRDFSRVQVHRGPDAGQLARDLRARAFTSKRDIYFAPGRYEPQTPQGRHLLAHELTHVVQQKGGRASSSTIQREETEKTSSIQGQVTKDVPGPVTDKSNSQFTLSVHGPPAGKYYHYRWSVRDARNNAYRARSVDDNSEVWDYGPSKHVYINTPSLEAMLAKNAGLDCRILCRVLETNSPDVPSFYYHATESNSRVLSVGFDFLPAPDKEKIATVFEHLRQAKWDVDTLAAKLTDSEMLSLELSKRVSLISYVAAGSRVDDEDETTINRLIRTTPSKDTKALFDHLNADNAKLYKRLEDVIHGENYREYHRILNSKFPQTMEPEEALQKMETAPILPWASPGLIHAFWNRRFVYEDVSINDKGKIHIEFWSTFMGMGLKMSASRDLDPNELIGVYFYFQEEEVGAPKGKTIYMPAVNFLALYNKQFRQNWGLVADVALLALGGAGILGAATKLGRVVAALELAFAVADITINEFRSEIAETEAGREFLKVWDKVSFVVQAYGMARVALKVPGVFKELRGAFRDFKGSKPKLEPGDLAKVEDNVNDVLKKAEDVAEEGSAGARTGTPGTEPGKPAPPGVKSPEPEKPPRPGPEPETKPAEPGVTSSKAPAPVRKRPAGPWEKIPCFVAGTLVSTSEGPVAIEQLSVGDYVLGKSLEADSPPQSYRVSAVPRGVQGMTIHIVCTAGIIDTTRNHPFYVADKGWVAAWRLQRGDKLEELANAAVYVESVESVYQSSKVETFNLEVEHASTYYVYVGGRSVLVHNNGAAQNWNRTLYWLYGPKPRVRTEGPIVDVDGLSVWRTGSADDVRVFMYLRQSGTPPQTGNHGCFTAEELKAAGLSVPRTPSDDPMAEFLDHHSIRPQGASVSDKLSKEQLSALQQQCDQLGPRPVMKPKSMQC